MKKKNQEITDQVSGAVVPDVAENAPEGTPLGPQSQQDEPKQISALGGRTEATRERRLFALFVARVGSIDFVHTVRRQPRVLLSEALAEAKAALEFYEHEQKGE